MTYKVYIEWTFGEGKEWTNLIVTTNDSKELKFHDVFGEELIGLSKKKKYCHERNSFIKWYYLCSTKWLQCNSNSPLVVTKENVEQTLILKESP